MPSENGRHLFEYYPDRLKALNLVCHAPYYREPRRGDLFAGDGATVWHIE
jgi:hypothetical protein